MHFRSFSTSWRRNGMEITDSCTRTRHLSFSRCIFSCFCGKCNASFFGTYYVGTLEPFLEHLLVASYLQGCRAVFIVPVEGKALISCKGLFFILPFPCRYKIFGVLSLRVLLLSLLPLPYLTPFKESDNQGRGRVGNRYAECYRVISSNCSDKGRKREREGEREERAS